MSSTLQAINDDSRLFRDTLLESGRKSRLRHAWVAVGSLAFQLALLVSLIIVPLFQPEKLPTHHTLTMLFVPPTAASSGITSFRVPTPTTTPKRISIPTPMHMTQENPPPPPVGTAGGVTGGVPGGLVGGVSGEVLGEVLNDTRSVPMPALEKTSLTAKRMRIASRVAEANLIYDVAPAYPPEAGRARIEGTVVLLAVIGKDGTVQDVRVESGLPVLAQAAADAVRQWRYRPYLLNGEPIEVDSKVTITFTLSRG